MGLRESHHRGSIEVVTVEIAIEDQVRGVADRARIIVRASGIRWACNLSDCDGDWPASPLFRAPHSWFRMSQRQCSRFRIARPSGVNCSASPNRAFTPRSDSMAVSTFPSASAWGGARGVPPSLRPLQVLRYPPQRGEIPATPPHTFKGNALGRASRFHKARKSVTVARRGPEKKGRGRKALCEGFVRGLRMCIYCMKNASKERQIKTLVLDKYIRYVLL